MGKAHKNPPQMESSSVLALEPLAPVIVRSGRPFDGSTVSDPARLPPPSTLAGCLRTASARAKGQTFSSELFQLAVAGPLLCRGEQLLIPKPADAHYFGHGDEAELVRAAPRAFDEGCHADLPQGLLPVRLCKSVTGKAGSGPAWWSLEHWQAFRSGTDIPHSDLQAQGWNPALSDRRTHVAIDPDTGGASEGKLFQTEGLDLAKTLSNKGKSADAISLLARFAEPLGQGLVHLGGERRLAALQPLSESIWPQMPSDWPDTINQLGGLSLTLVTPGLFDAGYRPDWLDEDGTGCPPGLPELRLQLCAVVCERWQPHSGWDLAKNQPRGMRKLIPAGAVYWFKLLQAIDSASLKALWLSSLCDQAQDRRDGFGLALPAPWQPVPSTN
jgi:CRISPR-associated protein Cmr3